MIIDLILDRKDGQQYDAREFYFSVMDYRETAGDWADGIARALDSGTEDDVRGALCRYIIEAGYPAALCAWICRQNWL